MAFRSLGWLIVLSACSPRAAAVADAAPDVAPDVDYCASPYVFTPVTVTGTSPRGSLDIFHYAVAGYGGCPDGGMDYSYVVEFTPVELDPNCASTALWLWILHPYSTTGTNGALADLSPSPDALTDMVTFEATQLDPPDATPPHIVGHFVSHDPAWSFDIAVDLISQYESHCL